MRELGELPHFVEKRLHSAAAAATKYCQQFPSPIVSAAAGFVAYITASAAALVIVVALTHDWLAERHALGHTLVWWLAAAGLVLAAVRGAMEDEAPAYDPVRRCSSRCRPLSLWWLCTCGEELTRPWRHQIRHTSSRTRPLSTLTPSLPKGSPVSGIAQTTHAHLCRRQR